MVILLVVNTTFAQVGINTTLPNAQLDIRSSNQALPSNTDGLLIPKIDVFPATNPTIAQQGMLVYLTTTVGTNQPGFYFWDNATTDWKPIIGATSAGTLDQAYDFGGAGLGKTITADAGAVVINGTDGLVSTGTLGSGAIAPSGDGVKMFWNPRKAAFRAGRVTGTQWDDGNLGDFSTAFGSNTTASGIISTAFGTLTAASGERSTAFGYMTKASGFKSTAFGDYAEATGQTSTAFGKSTKASGFKSTAFGDETTATGITSTAFGYKTIASGELSTAFGNQSEARGKWSTAFGIYTLAYEEESTAFGVLTKAYGKTSTAFGEDTTASGELSTAFGYRSTAGGIYSTSFGAGTTASGGWSTAFGGLTLASGTFSTAFGELTKATAVWSTAFGNRTKASGSESTAFGAYSNAVGSCSTVFGHRNSAVSFGETVLGIGATEYTPTGGTLYSTINGTDRLFVIGNAIDDTNNNGALDATERSDAMIVLKNGLTRLPSTTNAMITAADGKAIVTKEYLQSTASGTLDQAYDFGGAGLGNTITADAGAVLINGTDGFVSTGLIDVGAIAPNGAGVKMFWNPRKASLRAGIVTSSDWNDINIGFYSTAFGSNTRASGQSSTSFGTSTNASGLGSTTFGSSTNASALNSTAFGSLTTASGIISTCFGHKSTASGFISTAFGNDNSAVSCGETVFGIGATEYTPSTSGATQFRVANATDRLFVIGNAIDANNNGYVDTAERSDAVVVLKNGKTGIGTSIPDRTLEVSGTGNQFARISTTSPADVGIEFKRSGTDWQIRNDAGSLIFGQSIDNLSTVTNIVRIGTTSFTPAVDNEIYLGQSTRRWTAVYAINGFIQTSDANDKKEMLPLTYGLEKIKSLRPISFQWKNDNIDKSSTHLGFVAQEVQQVLPEIVVDHEWKEIPDSAEKVWEKTDKLGMKYAEIIPVLVKAIQEQQTQIEELKAKIEKLENK